MAVTIVVHEDKRLGRGIDLAALAEDLKASDVGLEFLTGELDRAHLPPTPSTGLAWQADPGRIRNRHDHASRVTKPVTQPCIRPFAARTAPGTGRWVVVLETQDEWEWRDRFSRLQSGENPIDWSRTRIDTFCGRGTYPTTHRLSLFVPDEDGAGN